MRRQRNVRALNKSSIYDYDERIIRTYALIDKFGSDTVKMVGNIIPVLAEPYGSRGKYTINVDKKELLKKQTVLAK